MGVVVAKTHEWFKERRKSEDQRETKYWRTFQIVCDDVNDGPQVASTASILPIIGDVLAGSSPAAYLRLIEIKQSSDDGLVFDATAQYTTPIGGGIWDQDPLLRPLEASWSFDRNQEEVHRCRNTANTREAILNSADEPYDPAPMRDVSRPVLTMVKNQAAFDAGAAVAAMDLVNSITWHGVEPNVAKIAHVGGNYRSEVVNQITLYYWRVTYRIEFNFNGWNPTLIDRGRRYWTSTDAQTGEHFYTEFQRSEPTLLDGAGIELQPPPDPPIVQMRPANPNNWPNPGPGDWPYPRYLLYREGSYAGIVPDPP